MNHDEEYGTEENPEHTEEYGHPLLPEPFCTAPRKRKRQERASLAHLAKMALHREGFCALPIAMYQLKHRVDDAALAVHLGCSVENLPHLRLCFVPRTDHFEQDIAAIATHIHADALVLARLFAPQEQS